MAYFGKTVKVTNGERIESRTSVFDPPSSKVVTLADLTVTSSRSGTVTPGWYKKSKERILSYTRRDGTQKFYYKTKRERKSEEELADEASDPWELPIKSRYRLSPPENPFQFLLRIERAPYGEMFYHTPYQRIVWVGVLGSSTISYPCEVEKIPTADLAAQENLCVNKVLLKMKDQKINALQALSELSQTAQLMGNTALRITGMLRSLKKGDLSGAAKALGVSASKRACTRYGSKFSPGNLTKSIGDGVLELQYGWKPLLQDCYGSAEAIAQQQIGEIRNVAKARVKRFYKPSRSNTATVSYRDITDSLEGRILLETSMRFQFAVSKPALHSLTQLGFSNPAVIAWELCPWSFVADWFIPFGNYLSSLDATAGLTFISGSKTVFMRQELTRKQQTRWMKGLTNPSGNWTGSSTSWLTDISVTRTVLTSFPSSRPPAFKNPLSFDHCLNALALLSGFVKRVK